MEARAALEVLTEALGEPRRRLETYGDDLPAAATAAWDCGCRARASAEYLRRWDSCGEHAAFRDAVMTQLAITAHREDGA